MALDALPPQRRRFFRLAGVMRSCWRRSPKISISTSASSSKNWPKPNNICGLRNAIATEHD